MQKWILVGAIGAVAILGGEAMAATSSGSGWYLEDSAASLFLVVKNVINPLLLLGLVAVLAGTIGFGVCQIGQGIGRLLLAGAILCGGIQAILTLVGGTIVQAVVGP